MSMADQNVAPRNERLDNIKPPYNGMNDETRKKLTDNTPDKEIDEALNEMVEGLTVPDGGGYDSVFIDKNMDENLRKYIDERINKAKSKLKSLILKDREEMLEFVIPEKKKETWLNKYLVESELKWAKKAIPEASKRGYNQAIDDMSQRAKEWSKKNG